MEFGEFTIEYDDYAGDFDLDTTIKSGQTSQPAWTCNNNIYSEILLVNDRPVLVDISQSGLNMPVVVQYYSDYFVNEENLRKTLFYIFDLNYDITQLYDFILSDDKLKGSYDFNKGLRLYKAQFPFECIISSICSANNSIKRWTKSILDLKKAYGKEVTIDNRTFHMFPDETEFINIDNIDLKNYGVGYRSDYMLKSTAKILNTDTFHETINDLTYEKSYEKIITLDGVGPKVADCILLYGYVKKEAYPVDVWINRITSYLFFDGKKPNNKKITDFAHENFGEYAGYVQLYLFNYARLSGLMDKLKK